MGLIVDLADEQEALITIEEGSIGGFGSLVAQLPFEHRRLPALHWLRFDYNFLARERSDRDPSGAHERPVHIRFCYKIRESGGSNA